MTRSCFARTLMATFLVGLTVGVRHATAGMISPGFDLFRTVSPTSATFGGMSIDFKGVPFPAVNNLGNTDTVVSRTGSLPAGGTGAIPIEIVALHLVSVSPITVAPFGLVDVHALINKAGGISGLPSTDAMLGGTPSTGTLTVTTHADPTGGMFDSLFPDVVSQLILTPPGGNINSPLATIVFHENQLSATGVPWSHIAPPNYPSNLSFPSGMFFVNIMFMETGPLALHTVTPSTDGGGGGGVVPEPSTLSLLASAVLTGVVGTLRKNRLRRRP